MIWKDVRSEGEIDHRNAMVVVGGAVPNVMVNLTTHDRLSRMYVTAGPYATLEEARVRAEVMAGEHGIDTIYRVLPLNSSRSPLIDGDT